MSADKACGIPFIFAINIYNASRYQYFILKIEGLAALF